MNVKAVVFDLDGPILDSFREGQRRIKIVSAIFDIPYTRAHHELLRKNWGMPGIELLVESMGMSEQFVRETFYPAWERLDIQQPLPLVPRTREVLFWLRRNKFLCTILTSRHRDHVLEMFDRLDLARDFAVISTKFDTPYRKPDPRVFRYTLEKLAEEHGISGTDCIFVGDTPADIDCGRAASIETLLVQTGPYLLKHAEKLPLPLSNVLNSIDDLPGWIETNHETPIPFMYD